MRPYYILAALLSISLFGCSGTQETTQDSVASSDMWVTLFDGSSLDGWQQSGPGQFTLQDDGTMLSSGGMGLFYYAAQSFRDYELELDWKVATATTNSGIFLRFPEAPDPWVAVNTGYEIQIDDSQNPMHQTGAVYDFSAAFKLASNPVGEWNTYRIQVTGQRYKIWLNDVLVNDFMGDRTREGYIGVQNHDDGSQVWFRNIRVKSYPEGSIDTPESLGDLFAVDAETEKIRVLMVTTTHGFRHGPAIDKAKEVMAELSQTTEFEVDVTEEIDDLNSENLANYDLLFFSNATLRVPSEETEQEAEPTATVSMMGTYNNWDLALDSGQGIMNGKLALSGSAADLSGGISFDVAPQPAPLSDVTLDGNQLSFSWDAGNFGTITASVELDGDDLAGTMAVQGSEMPLTGTATGAIASASMPSNAPNEWDIALSTPQGDMNGSISLDDNAAGGTISFDIPGASPSPLEDVVLEGESLSFAFDGGQYGRITGQGTLDGEAITGSFNVGGNEMAFTGSRKGASTGDSNTAQEDAGPRITEAHQEAIMSFLQAGKGIVGAHSALDALYGWDEYREMVGGGLFDSHPWTQSVDIVIEEPDNASVSHFGGSFSIRDEIYVLDENPRWNARVLASLDMSSVGITEGPADFSRNDYPMSWIREHNGGRVFYTKLGHFPDVWTTPDFLQHLLQGMRMAAGRLDADFSGHRVKEVIAENVWPDDIAIDDRGNVWIAELRGKIHHYDAEKHETRQIAHLPTTDPTKIEHGLYGIEVDPNFYSGEPYIYLFYAEQETFINTLSRYEYRDGEIDLSTEHVLLRVPTEPNCCHQAGDLEWGPDGTLYISTGDTGMSETRPDWKVSEEDLEAFKARHDLKDIHWSRLVDSERSSQNLQDLRGKILRINKDGTIPKDNPFYGEPGVRWEIYAYGLRNPYRFKVDHTNGNLIIGVVGPDAQFDYDEYNISENGGENYGWPRTIGRLFYNEWTPEMIPNYVPPMWEYTYESGGRSATVGPIYRHEGEGAFPATFQNKVFLFDWARRWIKWADIVDGEFSNDIRGDLRNTPLEVSIPGKRLANIKTFDVLRNTAPISMELSPDGSIYVAEFDGFWDAGPNAKVTRYRWVTGEE